MRILVPFEAADPKTRLDVVLDADERDAIGEITVENPAFDVTPPRYVDAIVTERGQFPPESIVMVMRELFGEGPTEPWEG